MNRFLAALVDRVVHLHNRGLITTSVAVVGRREYCNNLSIVLPLVTFHDKLMCACNKVKTVNMGELLCNVLAERITGSPR